MGTVKQTTQNGIFRQNLTILNSEFIYKQSKTLRSKQNAQSLPYHSQPPRSSSSGGQASHAKHVIVWQLYVVMQFVVHERKV